MIDHQPAVDATRAAGSRRLGQEAWKHPEYSRAIQGPYPARRRVEWTLVAATAALLLASAGLFWT
jgi:hypothetical protein